MCSAGKCRISRPSQQVRSPVAMCARMSLPRYGRLPQQPSRPCRCTASGKMCSALTHCRTSLQQQQQRSRDVRKQKGAWSGIRLHTQAAQRQMHAAEHAHASKPRHSPHWLQHWPAEHLMPLPEPHA